MGLKNSWLNLPYWLKGGLIGFIIPLVLWFLPFLGIAESFFEKILGFALKILILEKQCIFLTQCLGEACYGCLVIGIFLFFIEYTIIGIILGLVYGKLKSKNN